MRDIVTTLQAEQDHIVRDGYAGVLVVQGGPGTGKTAVALRWSSTSRQGGWIRLTAALGMAFRTGLPHSQAWPVFQQRLIELIAQHVIDQMESAVFTDTGDAIDGGSADGRLGAADLRALADAAVRHLLDEAAAIIGDTNSAAGSRVTFGHVVVDETQELSAMAWRMVMRRCPTR